MATALTVTKTEKRGEHMIDLHTHLLPGLDDGTRVLGEHAKWHELQRSLESVLPQPPVTRIFQEERRQVW